MAVTPRQATGWAVINTLVIVYALLPVLWILSLSLKPTQEVKDGKLIPSSITFDNYRGIFKGDVFTSALVNSLGIGLITTAIAVVALAPLHKAFGIKRVIVSTYQATSGAGAEGMAELERETKRVLVDGEAARNEVFAHPIAFNVIPHIDAFQPNGYTKEEMKVVWETRKIMGLPDLPVSCTAVRIPTMRVHAEAITIETERPITPEAAREVLRHAPGVKVVDDVANKLYPMPLTATGQDDCEVGRIRQNLVFGAHGLDLFVCGDQLLKGAALNAVQIAERVPALKVAA
jgi:aspartate-semialdehyde dehydrogenase